MIALPRRIVRCWGVLRLLCACGLVAPGLADSGTSAAESSSAPESAAASSLATPARGFRLGTGAAPFGSAAAVADFNHDGVADFAVVDRINSSVAQHRYIVQIAVSTAHEQRFTLLSPHEAVTVVVEDIDQDDDLDVVVTPPLTREVLALWVNDGFGHFAPELRTAPTRLGSRDVLSADHSVASPPPALAAERTLSGCSASGTRVPKLDAARRAVVDVDAHVNRILVLSAIDSRGPPSLLLL